jgi:hypothetical protein
MALPSKRSLTRMQAGSDEVVIATFYITDDDGSKSTGLFWVLVPHDMRPEQAMVTQPWHGPFASRAEADENKRIVLTGWHRKVSGVPAWDKLQ